MATACPHCGAMTAETAAFCGGCGKAVPGGAPTGPRIVESSSIASTSLGRTVQGAELAKEAKKSFSCLLAVAILQTIVTALVAVAAFSGVIEDPQLAAALKGATFVVGAVALVLYALAFWARRNPLPAAITGLVLLVSLWALDILADPANASRGIFIKVIIVVVLVKAIQAGLAYRRLQAAARAA